MAEHPPQWHHPNKRTVHEIACPRGVPIRDRWCTAIWGARADVTGNVVRTLASPAHVRTMPAVLRAPQWLYTNDPVWGLPDGHAILMHRALVGVMPTAEDAQPSRRLASKTRRSRKVDHRLYPIVVEQRALCPAWWTACTLQAGNFRQLCTSPLYDSASCARFLRSQRVYRR